MTHAATPTALKGERKIVYSQDTTKTVETQLSWRKVDTPDTVLSMVRGCGSCLGVIGKGLYASHAHHRIVVWFLGTATNAN